MPLGWQVDPTERMLEVYVLQGAAYARTNGYAEEDAGRYEPFDAVETALGRWWSLPPL